MSYLNIYIYWYVYCLIKNKRVVRFECESLIVRVTLNAVTVWGVEV